MNPFVKSTVRYRRGARGTTTEWRRNSGAGHITITAFNATREDMKKLQEFVRRK